MIFLNKAYRGRYLTHQCRTHGVLGLQSFHHNVAVLLNLDRTDIGCIYEGHEFDQQGINSPSHTRNHLSDPYPQLHPPSAIRHPPLACSPRIRPAGFDLHRLEPGLKLIVGGLEIAHDHGCAAHSDGDVVYHSVTDAILGALAQDDIGQLFPDNDPKWKGADSRVFVEEAVKRMGAAGFDVGNLDVTVILQQPKLSPHKAAIRSNLAGLLGCEVSKVNIKGKTHEKVDAIGEGRAIGCHVVVLLTPLPAGENGQLDRAG